MKVGVVLPVFEHSPALALDVARQAESEGLDGVFCYDHLFPRRRPDRPALASVPVLAAVASITSRVRVGPMVSRVLLLPHQVLVDSLMTIDRLAEGRLIAGLGAGDHLTVPEHAPYGLPFPGGSERLARLQATTEALRAGGVHVWIGGRSAVIRRLAGRVADGWNCWEGAGSELATFSPRPTRPFELSWGGLPPRDGELLGHLRGMAACGAAWVVYGPPPGTDWPRFMTKLTGAAEAVQ